jgi:hypothetical protein
MSTLKVGTIQSTGGTNAFTINASGYVSRSQNISFKAYSTNGDVTYGNAYTTVIWSTTQHNLGNCYSTSTGIFTAPIAGTYHFGFHAYRQGASGYTRMWIVANSNSPAYMIERPDTSYATTWNEHCTVYLNANDYVYCQIQADSNTNFYFAEDHSFFYGFLIG